MELEQRKAVQTQASQGLVERAPDPVSVEDAGLRVGVRLGEDDRAVGEPIWAIARPSASSLWPDAYRFEVSTAGKPDRSIASASSSGSGLARSAQSAGAEQDGSVKGTARAAR